ncbi:MAG: hypothetical protein M3155_00750 [Actinomycetota bacterium]|nr:hypothetical protein [Actinomycetota bacterium]
MDLRARASEAGRARLVAWAPYVLILVGYVLLRLDGFVGVDTLRYADTASYLEVASHSIFSLDFWAGARAWTLPLLYKIAPDGASGQAAAQFAVSVVCWPLLAAAVARCLRPGVYRYVALVVVLLFSMALPIIQWDRVLISESLSISLTALVLAAWLELVRAPRPATVVGVLVVSILWVFVRDSNGVIALAIVPVVLLWALWRPGPIGRVWPLVLAGGLATTFALSLLATGTEAAQLRRTERPILHVIGRRVLADPAETRWFRSRGMPKPPPRIVKYRRSLAGIVEGTIPSDPATQRFLDWARRHGRSVLARYLLAHPWQTVKQTFDHRKRLLSGVTVGYLAANQPRILPRPIERVIYPRRLRAIYLWLLVVGLAALVVWRWRGASRTWLVPVAALALQVPHAIVVYQGDTLEIPRHAILVAVTTRLAIVLLALLVVGRLVDRRRPAPS